MPVIAMKITKAEKHPNADRLRLYEAWAPEWTRIRIDDKSITLTPEGVKTVVFIANLTNVYEVGDVVAVAQVGTVLGLEDELLEIAPTKIRKVDSYGMGLGKTSSPVGCDLTNLYPWPEDTKVKTLELTALTAEWADQALVDRRSAGRIGTIVHVIKGPTGLCYVVQHDDDQLLAGYAPQELAVLR